MGKHTRKSKRFVWRGKFTVYMLECKDGSYYTGQTNDLEARLKLHASGKGAKYVRSRKPFQLVYTKSFRSFQPAYAEECRIKKLTREEKVRLVNSPVFTEVKSRSAVRIVEALASEIWREHFVPVVSLEQIEYMLKTFQSSDAIVEQINHGMRYYLVRVNKQNAGYLA